MKFTNLIIDNFLSVSHVETRLDDKGLVLVQGVNDDSEAFESNGSGKSTIFSEAPCWCLFGETVRGKKGDSVVNRDAKKNCRVLLGMLSGDNQYEVIRHRKHKDAKNNVHLFRNGKNITGKSDAETNKMIQELLDIDYMTFTNSILFGQGISKTFPGATDSEQKAILERMLQIDIFRMCQDNAKQRLSECKLGTGVLRQGIEGKLQTKKSLTEEIESLQDKELELQNSLLEDIDKLEKELSGYTEDLNSLSPVDDLVKDKEAVRAVVSQIDQKMKSYDTLEKNLNQLLVDIKSIERQNQSYELEIKSTEKELSDIRNGKNIPKTCRLCGQKLPLKDTTHIENGLEDSIKKNRGLISENQEDLENLVNLRSKVETQLQGKKNLQESKDSLLEEISSISTEIAVQENKKSSLQKLIHKVSNQIQEKRELIGTTYSDIIESKVELVEDLEKQIKQFSEDLDRETKYEQNLEFWVTAFGNKGIKSVLLDSVTPYLNQRANYYLSNLTDNTMGITFNTQSELKDGTKKDKFSVEITNENGDNDYKGNSGGEKKRIDIAINMALQDLMQSRSNKSIDLIVYDEVYEALDNVGCETVIQLLQEKAKQCGTVLVITHNEHLKQMFTKSLTVKKKDKKTVILEENV